MNQHGNDCLHCVIWPTINKFCDELGQEPADTSP
jgi:hypothetical protein